MASSTVPNSGLLQVSGSSGSNTSPSWFGTGTTIAYVSDRDGNKEIYATLPNVTGADVRLTTTAADETAPAYSPDGTSIALAVPGGLATIPSSGASSSTTAIPNTVAGDTSPDWQDASPPT